WTAIPARMRWRRSAPSMPRWASPAWSSPSSTARPRAERWRRWRLAAAACGPCPCTGSAWAKACTTCSPSSRRNSPTRCWAGRSPARAKMPAFRFQFGPDMNMASSATPNEPPFEISPVQEIVNELRAGHMVILVDEEDRENEGDLVLAADFVTPDAINFMVTHARGLVCLTLTHERCDQLQLPMMSNQNGTRYGTNFTVSIEAAEG